MANTRDIKRQIGSVQNIQKITSTMEKVATARINLTKNRLTRSRLFYHAYIDMADHLEYEVKMQGLNLDDNPDAAFMYPNPNPSNVDLIIIITSNRGLCGGFNNNTIMAARNLINKLQIEQGKKSELMVIGKKAANYFKFVGRDVYKTITDIDEKMTMQDIQKIADEIIEAYNNHEFDNIHLVYQHYYSTSRQYPEVDKFLPLDTKQEVIGKEDEEETSPLQTYVTTDLPPDEMYIDIGYRLAQLRLFHALLESQASEQVARKTAMKQATDSAGEMIGELTKLYNRTRQAKITTELTEIVGAAKAME